MNKILTLFAFMLSTSVAFGQLVINEVLYDPSNTDLEGDANGDGAYDQEEDSYIEFVNVGTTNFDASGYQIWDDTTNGQLRFVIPDDTWVPPYGALVVFGGGTLTGSFGGAIVFKTDSADGMNFNNSGEVIVIKDKTGKTVLTFDSDALSNNPNESYTRNPDVTGDFEQHADNTSILFSPGTKVDGTPFNTKFVVSTITVMGENNATEITTLGGTLQMEAVVMPTFADDKTVVWSVPSGNGVATISASGLLSALTNGKVVVTATANDGSGITGTLEITISGQTTGIDEVATSVGVFPNPANNRIYLQSETNITHVQVVNVSGQVVVNTRYTVQGLPVDHLPTGMYVIRATTESGLLTTRFSKQ